MSTQVMNLLKQRLRELQALTSTYSTWEKVKEWHARARPLLVQYYPDQLSQFDEFINVKWSAFPRVVISGMGPNQNAAVDQQERMANDNAARAVKAKLVAHLEAIIELGDLAEKMAAPPPRLPGAIISVNQSRKVFVVHGHDDAMQQAAARTLTLLGFEPIILLEQANEGKTIIEKFVDSSGDVGFAVVLCSPDDMAYPISKDATHKRPRPRQNVVLELGYFAAKLGRSRVFVLKRSELEMPSDISGVVYSVYDNPTGMWRVDLARELKAAGYDVDLNNLI